MKLTEDLSDFNRRLAAKLDSVFSKEVKPVQGEDGALLFRGPVVGEGEVMHTGTHVSVRLDAEVQEFLLQASNEQREASIEKLLLSLSSQVLQKYDPARIGRFALPIVGSKDLL